ncbi:ABC-type bacteriocin/lantibiotic exporter with double-glycine peptidase domain [Bradyrhizobium sp. S3.14.4]
MRDGGFLILGKAGDGKAIVQYPGSPRPQMLTKAQFEVLWDGRIVLMTKRAGLADLSRRFDITWFMGAVNRYRGLLGEVLLASFFLQIFALVSPLFFQVVIDKVLVHRSLGTLDVLVAGIVAISIFEVVLGALRTYLFSHTTNRIDVELGARLFHHLLALPLSYFQARRVGDTVARVRELENLRNFITGSALTLVIDLFFTFVFLGLMAFYSPLLTAIVLASFPLYIVISAGATPLFRYRLDEKFKRGAENQSFLVESVTGVETLKAMAVEPQMQKRWEEQLAGYVASSFRVVNLGNVASQAVQFVSKINMAILLYFGAKLVIDGNLTVRRARRLQHAVGTCHRTGASARPALAGFPPGAAVGRAARRHPQHRARADPSPGSRGVACHPWRHHLRACRLPLSRRRTADPERHHPEDSGRPDRRHRRHLRLRQEHARKTDPEALSPRERPRAGRRQ